MGSTKTKDFPLEMLPQQARKAHVLPGIKRNLLSVPVLCDTDCVCTFSKDKFVVTRNKKKIIEGPRDPITNLWCVPIPTDNNNNRTITTIRNDANLAMTMIE